MGVARRPAKLDEFSIEPAKLRQIFSGQGRAGNKRRIFLKGGRERSNFQMSRAVPENFSRDESRRG